MKKFLKEPLFHFVLLGALIFIVYALFGRHSFSKDKIVVTTQDIEYLTNLWMREWNRTPTKEELNNIINDYIQEEALYREALKLGLDKDDKIVRRRMAQKMKFIMEDNVEVKDPTEQELKQYFEKNKERYKESKRYSFYQIAFLGGEESRMKALDIKEKLKSNPSGAETYGNHTSIPYDISDKSNEEIDMMFGQGFSAHLKGLKLNEWQEPLRSGLGYHVINIYKTGKARIPEFEQIKSTVQEDWMKEEKQKLQAQKLKELIGRYDVEVESNERKSKINE